ncbi:FKBP-type peptidyl-prolyl cis-trans isomerase [Georgenia sp. Z1344]|uniref:FKBP-type peptidyl-prolyl cis-trans isomerase n=1 Tax=Georgenia sp. Z1344 TaxID=3416706 RepID=UPI003CE92141
MSRAARGPVARRAAVLACAAALGLAACGPDEGGGAREATSDSMSEAAATGVEGVSVAGAPGHPVVVIDTPLAVGDPVASVVDPGDGRALTAGGPALLSVAAWDGTTGQSSSREEVVAPRLATVSEADVGATLAEILPGVREGGRVVVAEPVDVEGALTMQVVVVDVLPTVAGGSPSESASGETGSQGAGAESPTGGESPSGGGESPTDGSGSPTDGGGAPGPTVGTTADGAPVVGIPPGDPPADLQSRVVVEGDGTTVRPGQDLVLQTLTMDWETGEVLSSSWADGSPSTAVVEDLGEGVRLALLDRRVGSRILAVVPPGLGDGEHTLVVVVDVLAASGGDDVVRQD